MALEEEKHEIAGIFMTTAVTMGYSDRSACSHLAADLNFSRYWWRRLSCPGRSIRVQVLPWIKGGRVNSHMLVTKNTQTGEMPTRSLLTLYGALLSVMEVCVRLNFPDNSCQTWNGNKHHFRSVIACVRLAATHPGKQEGFPRVTQSHQKNGTSDGFTGQKVLQEH